MSKEDGGRAFPASEYESVFDDAHARYVERLTPPVGGMSLRDYFAAKAMTALLSQKYGANILLRVIRQRRSTGESLGTIAVDFGVSKNAISKIARGERWAWLS